MDELRRRALLAGVAGSVGATAGCLDLLSSGGSPTADEGQPAVFVAEDRLSFEPAGRTLTGQIAASGSTAKQFDDADSFDPGTGSFTVTGTDRDVIGYEAGTLSSLAFTVEGDAEAKVFREGELIAESTGEFSRSFGTGTRSARTSPTPIEATVVDSFEDGDLDEYVVENGSATIRTEDAWSGGRSLYYEGDGRRTGLGSTGGLPAYPTAGDTFSARVTLVEPKDLITVGWGKQAGGDPRGTDGYHLKVNHRHQELAIFAPHAGGVQAETSVDPPLGEYLQLRVEWRTDGVHRGSVHDRGGAELAAVTMDDDEFADGGVAWAMNNGAGRSSTMHVDHFVIHADG